MPSGLGKIYPQLVQQDIYMKSNVTWVKVFRINPEFRIESQPQNAELSRL